MATFPLLDWCREAARKETPNREVEAAWWNSVAPTLISSLRERRHDAIALAEIDALLNEVFLRERFRYLTRGFTGEPTLRVRRGLLALVRTARHQRGEAKAEMRSLFASAASLGSGGPDERFGEWAHDLWRRDLDSSPQESDRRDLGPRVIVSLVSTSSASAILSTLTVQAVEATWSGLRPHPYAAATLVFQEDFAASIEQAWTVAGERHPDSQIGAAVWWIDGPARESPLNGDSHGGMLVAAYSALKAGMATDREFLASCALSSDGVGLRAVGGVRQKARAALNRDSATGRARVTRFFVHPSDYAEAVEGAADVGAESWAIVTGANVDELLLQSESAFGFPRRLARLEALRTLGFPKDAAESELAMAVDRCIAAWVPLTMASVGDAEMTSGPVDQLLEQHRRLVIEGAPGAGKSLLLRRFVVQAHTTFRPNEDGRLARPEQSRAVALVRATDLIGLETVTAGESDGGFLDAVAELLAARSELPAEEIRTALKQGRLTLAIDGLEDIGHTQAYDLSRRIGAQAASTPELRFVAVARSQTEGAAGFSQSGASRFRLASFGHADVDRALDLFTEEQPELRATVRRAAAATRLVEFATSPLLVRLFVDSIAASSNSFVAGVTPSRYAIYERYVSARLAMIPIQTAARERVIEALRTYAGILAYNLFDLGVRDGHTEQEFARAEKNCNEQYRASFGRSLSGDLLYAGLLSVDRTDGTIIRFFHMSVGEFLAAKRLAAEFDREDGRRRSRLVTDLIGEPNWRPTLEFVAGHTRDPLRYLEALVLEAESDPRPTTLLMVSNILRVMCAQPF